MSQIRPLPRHMTMEINSQRTAAAVLALSALDVGVWAQCAPHSFATSFPGFGHHWVAGLGPYNDHLTRDVGGLYLAMAVTSLWAMARPAGRRPAGVAWLVFSVPHLIFHLAHLEMYDATDRAGNVIALGGTVVLAVLLVLPARTHVAAGEVT